MQSVCASAVDDPARKKGDMRRKTFYVVRSVKKAMSVLSNLTNKADIYKPCAASNPTWTSEVNTIALSVVDSATISINASSWEERKGVHERVAKGIVAKLNASTYKDG